MGKSLYKKSKRQRLKLAKKFEAQRKREREFPFVVSIKESCGCCTAVLRFKNEANFLDRWNKLGLTVSGEITDDTGYTHRRLDTFYGHSPGSRNDRGLDYLLSQITGENRRK